MPVGAVRAGRMIWAARSLGLAILAVALPFPGSVSAATAHGHGRLSPDSPVEQAKGYAVAISGHFAIVGAPGEAYANNDEGGYSRGKAYIYAESNGQWTKQATLSDGARDGFGAPVAISGNVAVVGASNRFWVFTRSGSKWHRTGPLQPTALHTNFSGIGAISIQGNMIAIGIPADNHTKGDVRIFRYSQGRWSQKAIIWGPPDGDDFGSIVAISGRTIVISDDYDAVHVYVHEAHPAGGWRQVDQMIGSGQRLFGTAVAISGTTMAIGAPGATDSNGAVFIYRRGPGGWTRRARINPPGGGRLVKFGTALALSGGRLLISADNQTERKCGAAVEFVESGSTWVKTAKLLNPGCSPGDEFGSAIALSGRTAIIGAWGWHHYVGNAYVEQIP